MSAGTVAERRENRAVAAARPKLMADTLKEESEQRALLGEYVKREMVPDTDYGLIPGTDRRSLLKPGAEKLCSLFRCTPRFEIVDKTEDWDKPFFYYLFRVTVETNDGGAVVAEGFGSANSMEGKWRWRNADRKCPVCQKPAIKRSKFPPRENPQAEPGWYCFAKAGGCGANFAAADPAIVGQTAGRVENDDVATLVNTILKIAKKRALVDAAIALARCSDLFTQDVEDPEGGDHDGPAKARPAPERKAEPRAGESGSNGHPGESPTGGAAPAMLRTEFDSLVKRMAAARSVTAETVVGGVIKSAKAGGGNPPADAGQWQPAMLKFACDKLTGWLAEVEAAGQSPRPADPPPSERQPGDDDLSDGPEPEAVPAKPTSAAQSRKIIADQTLEVMRECGVDWGRVVEHSAKAGAKSFLGRTLARDAKVLDLSLEDHARVQEWCRQQKAAKAQREQPVPV